MLIERLELTMSHVVLGNLNEYALMVLFGNAHSHQLVTGLSITPTEMTSADGTELYPAYFMTRLRVPMPRLLSTFKLWDTVAVGVDVERFGETILASHYVVGADGEVGDDPREWGALGLPTMEGNNLIVAEDMNGETGKREVSHPDPSKIAELPKMRRAPAGLALARKTRNNGFEELASNVSFQSELPVTYHVKPIRDALDGKAMIFAKYAEILDVVEHDYLSSELNPSLSNALLRHLAVLERDIYYYGNCYAGEELAVTLTGDIELVNDLELSESLNYIPAGYLRATFEITQKRTGNLIAMCQVKKVFAIPMQDQEIIGDLRRCIQSHRRRKPLHEHPQ